MKKEIPTLGAVWLLSLVVTFGSERQEQWQAQVSARGQIYELTLDLRIDDDGRVTGTFSTETGDHGRIMGSLEGGERLSLTMIQMKCKGAFLAEMNLRDGLATGRFSGHDCIGELDEDSPITMVKARPQAVAGNEAAQNEISEDIMERCSIPHENGYLSWLCDEEGRDSETSQILLSRQSRFGETTILPVWQGPEDIRRDRLETIIQKHQAATEGCDTFFHISYLSEVGALIANRKTKHMEKWLRKNLGKKFPSLCEADSPVGVDFVLLWSDAVANVPYTLVLPRLKTYYHTGRTSSLNHQYGYTSGNYSGTTTVTEQQTTTQSRSVWTVTTWVVALNKDTDLVFEAKKTRDPYYWPFTKPGKDTMIKALQRISQSRN